MASAPYCPGNPASIIAPTALFRRSGSTSTGPPRIITTAVGLPTAATAAMSWCCTPGKSMLIRSCDSPSTDWSLPTMRMTLSACLAAATASAMPDVLSPSTLHPVAWITLPPVLAAATASCGDMTQEKSLALLSGLEQIWPRYEPSCASRACECGPMTATTPPRRNGSTFPSFFSKTRASRLAWRATATWASDPITDSGTFQYGVDAGSSIRPRRMRRPRVRRRAASTSPQPQRPCDTADSTWCQNTSPLFISVEPFTSAAHTAASGVGSMWWAS
mmetsp:Transcript_18742/g.71300  ORF Transcript_18742/g.71300 Transcript_18742/m.71300 type:complete len:275 (+) Transcript_18742:679-1503(+)